MALIFELMISRNLVKIPMASPPSLFSNVFLNKSRNHAKGSVNFFSCKFKGFVVDRVERMWFNTLTYGIFNQHLGKNEK
jgi:hypothetical protein